MSRFEWRPLALFLALCGSFVASAAAAWLILRHFGVNQLDTLDVSHVSFRQYFATRFFVWDAQWYDMIARVGYRWHPSATERQSIAFFPLWGLVIKPVYILAGAHRQALVVLLTAVVAYGSIHVVFDVGGRLVGERAAVIAAALYTFYPAANFLLQSYPTGLMNLMVAWILADLVAGREWRPALVAGIGTAAGPLMVVPSLLVWLVAGWRRRGRLATPGVLITMLGLGLVAVSGLLAFLAWQAAVFHDPFAFLAAQYPFDQHRGLAEKLWRFIWMILVVPDFFHIVRLGLAGIAYVRAGNYFPAFVRYEFAVNFICMTVLMIGLFWIIAVKPRLLLLYGGLVFLFFVWFHGTTHNGLGMMRLLYICLPCFWGWGRALQREPLWTGAAVGLSGAMLVAQEISSDIGQLVW